MVCHVAARARGAGLFEVTLTMCILNIFSCVCTVGTWPVHCVCSSYLVGCVMCRGIAKGSGNVDFFQQNHMNPTTTLPCPWACAVSPHSRGSSHPGSSWVLLGVEAGQRPDASSQLTSIHCLSLWILEDREVSSVSSMSLRLFRLCLESGWGCFGCRAGFSRTLTSGREQLRGWGG